MLAKGKTLFSDPPLYIILDIQREKMKKEIDAYDGDSLLNTSIEDLCDYFEEKYKFDIPQLKEDEITVDQEEVNIDVSQDPRRYIRDRNGPFYIKGTEIRFYVPFEGNTEFFEYRPSQFALGLPRATVTPRELIISYRGTDIRKENLMGDFNRELNEIKTLLRQIRQDVSEYNKSLRQRLNKRIEWRRNKLLKDKGLVASLGFPLKRRDSALKTYTVPTIKRKTRLKPSPQGTGPFVPEPELDKKDYEHILSVISNMVQVMERSPKAFTSMEEEDLRQHFLVQLNGQYEGQATGETFNFEGQTDILIRVNGRNIFIAECKFWKGQKVLKKTIDQILGYLTWRDCKAALLIFNRNKNFSNVLKQIPEVVKNHSNFKRQIQYPSETGFRYILHHRDDIAREIILKVLAFDIPK